VPLFLYARGFAISCLHLPAVPLARAFLGDGGRTDAGRQVWDADMHLGWFLLPAAERLTQLRTAAACARAHCRTKVVCSLDVIH